MSTRYKDWSLGRFKQIGEGIYYTCKGCHVAFQTLFAIHSGGQIGCLLVMIAHGTSGDRTLVVGPDIIGLLLISMFLPTYIWASQKKLTIVPLIVFIAGSFVTVFSNAWFKPTALSFAQPFDPSLVLFADIVRNQQLLIVDKIHIFAILAPAVAIGFEYYFTVRGRKRGRKGRKT